MTAAEAYARYARQTVLPEVGVDGQQKLSSASVLVVVRGPGLSGAAVSGRRRCCTSAGY